MVRGNEERMLRISWLFPNTYAVDPLRDLTLFNTMPEDIGRTILILSGFALLSLISGLILASKNLRKID